MLFNTLDFAVFFALFFAVFKSLKKNRSRYRLITFSSLFFYGWWNYKFVPLLLFSGLIDYWAALLIQKDREAGIQRRRWLVLSLCVNLGALGIFKYTNFFLDFGQSVFGLLGLHIEVPFLEIILPVGISFYTFQSMSYTIDVYSGSIKAQKNYMVFLSSLTFFPQLVAGPIVRAADLIPQLQKGPVTSRFYTRLGMTMVGLGLAKKTVADLVAPISDTVFSATGNLDMVSAWTGALAFTAQIYGDFAGYSEIAIGLGLLLGYTFPTNFNLPYISASPDEFWRRWHISLSTWLRDYLFFPIQARKGATAFGSIMITMILGGLWHGANYTFLVWGFYQGLLIGLSQIIREKSKIELVGIGKLFPIALTFYFTVLGWVLFRASSIEGALEMIVSMHSFHNIGMSSGKVAQLLIVIGALVSCHLVDGYFIRNRKGVSVGMRRFLIKTKFTYVVVGICILFTMFFSGDNPFIYFQF